MAAAYEVLGDDVKNSYDNERPGAQHGGGGAPADPPTPGYRPQQRFVFVRRNGRMYRVPLDDYDNFERSYQSQGLDSSVSLQMVALGLLAAFFYFSSAVAADVNGTGVPQRRRGGYEADEDEDDDAPPPLLNAGSSIRLLKAEVRAAACRPRARRRGTSRLLGMPGGAVAGGAGCSTTSADAAQLAPIAGYSISPATGCAPPSRAVQPAASPLASSRPREASGGVAPLSLQHAAA